MDYALSGLLKKRDELATDQRQLEVQVTKIKEDISALEAAIRVLDPEIKLPAKRPRRRTKNQFFATGEASRFCREALRDATAPISTSELAMKAAEWKGFGVDKIDLKAMKACILTTMSRLRINGEAVECGRAPDGAIKWELAQP